MKALLIVVVLLSLMVIGCQREIPAEPKPVTIIDTVYIKNDSLQIRLSYLQFCISKDCNRTDMCCQAIEELNDSRHDDDCPVYKQWVKRISKKAKSK